MLASTSRNANVFCAKIPGEVSPCAAPNISRWPNGNMPCTSVRGIAKLICGFALTSSKANRVKLNLASLTMDGEIVLTQDKKPDGLNRWVLKSAIGRPCAPASAARFLKNVRNVLAAKELRPRL